MKGPCTAKSSNMRLMNRAVVFLLAVHLLVGCYSFRGISIPADINTFSVESFGIQSSTAPQGVEVVFTERLRDKVRNESRLLYTDDSPDVVFSGKISSYRVEALSPEEGAVSAFNKLTISVQLNYDSMLNEEDSWTKTFSFFSDFDAATDLASVESELVDEIYDQLVEQIFNEAFTDW